MKLLLKEHWKKTCINQRHLSPSKNDFNVPKTDEEFISVIEMMVACSITFKDTEGKIDKRKSQCNTAVKEFNKKQNKIKKGKGIQYSK